MARNSKPKEVAVEPAGLDLGYLALFLGQRLNEEVLASVHAAGFEGLRVGHGYLFQHLIAGPQPIGALAKHLEMTQQGASKAVAELVELGFVVDAPADGADARVRRVQLSARGRAAVATTRAERARLDKQMRKAHGDRAVDAARKLLAALLEERGGAEAVRARRVKPPR